MKYLLLITESAERDMRRNHAWWAENRSEEQADRWLVGIDGLIYSLITDASRYGFATEPGLRTEGIKQAPFGLSGKSTHRVLYRIEGDQVVVYRVRAFKQDAIDIEELGGDSP